MNPQPEPQPELRQETAWCSSLLCDTWRDYDVLPGRSDNGHHQMPDWAFCCSCGGWLPDVSTEEAS